MAKLLDIDAVELLRDWDLKKNKKNLKDFPKTFPEKVWWKCFDCRWEWRTTILNRRRGSKCPKCSTNKGAALSVLRPDLLKEWGKNNVGELDHYTAGSTYKASWICQTCKHEWLTTVNVRMRDHGCPSCSAKNKSRSSKETSIGFLFPECLKFWNYDKNNDLDPFEISPGSSIEINWECCFCGNEFKSLFKQRRTWSKCPGCAGIKSIQYTRPESMEEWDYSKNLCKPVTVSEGSLKKVWWKCFECSHSWLKSPSERFSGNKVSGCPKCFKKVDEKNALFYVRPDLMLDWSENNSIDPRNIHSGSKTIVEWNCHKCGRLWETRVRDRAKAAGNCRACLHKRYAEPVKGLSLRDVSPELMSLWDYDKNSEAPENFSYGSDRKAWWICENGHSYEMAVRNKTLGCQHCPTSIHEKALTKFIKNLGFEVVTNSREIIKPLELDIYVPEKRVAIEFNGLYWHRETDKKNKNYHYNKYLACKRENITLIQIWEDDWKNREKLIKEMLTYKLNASKTPKTFARKTVVSEISYKETKKFLNENHIQGAKSGSFYYGLRKNDELVAVSVWRKEKMGAVLLDRYATSHIIPGGFSKIVKHVLNTYEWIQQIITFADHEVSNGNLYEISGFTKTDELKPDYKYIVNGERVHKFNYRLTRFKTDEKLIYKEGLSETGLAKLNKMDRVWDSGKTKYVLKRD